MNSKTIRHWAAHAALFLSAAANAQTYVWDMPNEYPATSVQGMGDKHFAELLKAKTQGDIKIVHHFGAALGFRSKDQLDAVADGAVVIANTFVPPLGGINPIFLLSSLPFLVSNAKEAQTLYEVARPYYDKALARYNQKLLYASPWPASGLWGARAYGAPEAIKGLKMRTYDPNGTLVFKAAGAAPVQLSWADIVPQLTTGGIEGVLTSIESGLSASFNDYAKHFTALNYDTTINMVTMNLDAWNKLPEERKKAVLAAAQETEQYLWRNLDGVIKKNYEIAAQRGVKITDKIDEGFRQGLQKQAEPVIAAWVKRAGKDGQMVIDQYRVRLKAAPSGTAQGAN
ncbi:TRAP transporter substrate-binding protein DctP [Comamonadaceae bacterium OH2545_COT-014]|nr:TRAP transporter substrate-binding protein DctP [Comamonadaceae bacterium OH2545_COT-014]